MANGDPKTYQDGYNDGYQAGLMAAGMLTQPVIPTWPGTVPVNTDPRCPDCGLLLKGAMGYVCPRNFCPTQPRFT